MRKNDFDFDFEIPIEFGDTEMVVGVDVKGYRFGTPARITGRPETSYPAEGSEFNDIELYLITEESHREDGKNRTRKTRTPLPDKMYDLIVEAYGGEDKWMEKIDEEAGEADDAARDEYYDRKYEEMMDEKYFGRDR